jgi:microcystin-dependent protein
MAERFIGEIRIFSFSYEPVGWAPCDGRLLNITQYQALFSLLGTTYGGDGRNTFALPDLRSRMPIGMGDSWNAGQQAGEERHALSVTEMPPHTHTAMASTAPGDDPSPQGRMWGVQTTAHAYSSSRTGHNTAAMAVSSAGQGQAHENMPPYQVVSFCIALDGIFPTRD